MKDIIDEYGEYITGFLISMGIVTSIGVLVDGLKLISAAFLESIC